MSLAAFAALERDLRRRRIARIEPRLLIELCLLALIVAGFVFWQTRIALASIAHDRGTWAAAQGALLRGAFLCVLAGALVHGAHARQLGGAAPGPAWLILPVTPRDLRTHLAWEARWHGLWVVPGFPALVAALVGLVPWWWLPLVAAVLVLLLLAAVHAGVATAGAMPRRTRHGLDPLVAALVTGERVEGKATPGRMGPWRRSPRWIALWEKDRRIGTRPSPARPRLVAAILLLVLSAGVWHAGLDASFARLLAFGLALAAAATFGEWIIALSGRDPFPVLRVLPIGGWPLWGSRMAWAALGATALALVQAFSARGLEAEPLRFLVGWVWIAALVIGALGVHYGITLFPRAAIAQRLYALTLGIAIAASLMIPLLGWITLLAALLHSARRLSHWSRLDETAA